VGYHIAECRKSNAGDRCREAKEDVLAELLASGALAMLIEKTLERGDGGNVVLRVRLDGGADRWLLGERESLVPGSVDGGHHGEEGRTGVELTGVRAAPRLR